MGAGQRGGKVKAQMIDRANSKNALDFLRSAINPVYSLLMTDESRVYRTKGVTKDFVRHEVMRHAETYVRGDVHTNTIEGFRSLLKRAWYRQHHHYRREFLSLYVANPAGNTTIGRWRACSITSLRERLSKRRSPIYRTSYPFLQYQ